MRRLVFVPSLVLALVCGGCCCGQPETGPRRLAGAVDSNPETGRRFVVLRATPMEKNDEGKRQLLVEASVVAVERDGPIDAIDKAQRLATQAAPAWLAGHQAPDVTFGADSRVEERPSVVTAEEEEATIQVGEETAAGLVSVSEIKVTPTFDAAGSVTLAFSYEHRKRGRLVYTVPQVALTGPAGRVFIVEAVQP